MQHSSSSFLSSLNLDFDNNHSINQQQQQQPNQLDLLELNNNINTFHPKLFPSTIQFDNQHFNNPPPPPQSSSSISYSTTPSVYTPSSESVSSFQWINNSLSNPQVLAPTAPDLTFSFSPSTDWTSINNTNNHHSNNNHLPTKDFKHPSSCSFDSDHEDQEEHDPKEENHGCLLTPNTPPISSPLRSTNPKKNKTSTTDPSNNSRPLSHMGFNSPRPATMMMATNSEKMKPKKSLAFILGGTGRIRSSTCLESQLEDVLSQQSTPAFFESSDHQPATTVYRLPQSEPSTRNPSNAHYQKTKNRLSAFLSFLPNEQPSLAPSTSSSTIIISNHQQQQQQQPQPIKNSNRRQSFNLLDRATLSFSNNSFRTFNSSTNIDNTQPYVSSPPNSSSKSPNKYSQPANGKPIYIKPSRSFLNLLSSKLK